MREALAWVEGGEPFDLGLVDEEMSEVDGRRFAESLRRFRDSDALPLVLVTSRGRRAGGPRGTFAAVVARPVRPRALASVLAGIRDDSVSRKRRRGSSPGLPRDLGATHPLRILLAEDNAVNQKVALLMLTRLGYRADVAATGREALEATLREAYDVVLMDVQMPEMDGLEATREIVRRWPEGERSRIVGVTAEAMAVMEGEEQDNPSSIEQREPLLRTKLFVPPLRPDRVSRPRLIERINKGLDKALILISAPAGYGKTTLVSSWLHETEIPSAWISLDEGDNDPIRFLQNFIAALDQIAPTLHSDLPGALKRMGPAPYDAILIVFNEIEGRSAPIILVLDDFHLIHSQSIWDTLAYLLDHMPPNLHLVVTTRSDPPLRISGLRARGQLVELRESDLRFTSSEAAEFLRRVMGLELSADDVAALTTRTEGWIAT